MTCFARFRLVVTLSPSRSSLTFTRFGPHAALQSGALLRVLCKLSASEGFDVSVPGHQALPWTPS